MTEYELDIESLLSRVNDLLLEWGEYQRREQGPPRMHYPSSSPGADMIDTRRRKDRDARAYTRPRQRVEVGGKMLQVRPMIPRQAERQTKVRKIGSPDWPEHVLALDQIMAPMPRPLIAVLTAYYVQQETVRSGADRLRVTKSTFEQRLDRARYLIAGQVVTDPVLSAA